MRSNTSNLNCLSEGQIYSVTLKSQKVKNRLKKTRKKLVNCQLSAILYMKMLEAKASAKLISYFEDNSLKLKEVFFSEKEVNIW